MKKILKIRTKNNKINSLAFTLVELLSLIIVLIVILMISLPNVFNIVEKNKQKRYDLLVDSIENGARLYVNERKEEVEGQLLAGSFYLVTVGQLNYKGLIKENLVNPLTNEVIPDTKKVFVYPDADNVLIYCFEDRECAIGLEKMPIITLLGDNPMILNLGTPYNEPGAIAKDYMGNNLNVNITGEVDVNKVGIYYINYQVIDEKGRQAFAQRGVQVINYIVPVITILGDNPKTIAFGSVYEDDGAVAFDEEEGDISHLIIKEAHINPLVVGYNYTVTYNVTNSKGIAAIEKVRIVKVIPKVPSSPASFTNPTESVIKSSTITVSWGATSSWGGPDTNKNYRLEVRYDGGNWSLVNNTGTEASQSHTVSSTANTLQYRVRAESGGGNSGWVSSSSIFLTENWVEGYAHPYCQTSRNITKSQMNLEVPQQTGSNWCDINNPPLDTYGMIGYRSDRKISLSGITTIKISWSNSGVGPTTNIGNFLDISDNNLALTAPYTTRLLKTGSFSKLTSSLDVSNYSSSYYIKLYASNACVRDTSSKLIIYSIWGENAAGQVVARYFN